jgi:hypothetical protein
MGGDAAALDGAQLVRRRLGQHFHPGLADVVGGVARRRGDALLGAGVDDGGVGALRDHGRREGLHAVDHAPEIDGEQPLPALVLLPRPAATAEARIVHEQRHFAEVAIGRFLQPLHLLQPADVGRHGARVRTAARELGGGAFECLPRQVRQTQLHAESSQPPGGSEADAAGGAGDDSRASRLQRRMIRHCDL